MTTHMPIDRMADTRLLMAGHRNEHNARQPWLRDRDVMSGPALDTRPLGSARARRRTRQTIFWASIAVFVLGVVFLETSLVFGDLVAPPVVVMVAGVLGTLFSLTLPRETETATETETGFRSEGTYRAGDAPDDGR